MAAAAAVSGLPLCAPNPMSLPAQRPVDVKPFQLPPSTLPSSQSLESVPGERGSTATPQKAFSGRLDVLRGGGLSSPLSTTTASEMDPRRSSFFARLAAATAKNHVNIAGDDATTGALAVPRALATAADDSEVTRAPRTLISSRPCLQTNVDGVYNNYPTRSGRELSNCTSVSGPGRHVVDDDHPLDLTAKTSVTTVPTEHPPDVCQPAEKDTVGTSSQDQLLSVRKVSRRKGVAHKLDTTSVNQWPAADVTNEPFDLVPLMSSPQPASGSQLQSADSSSRGASSPSRRGLSGSPQNAGEVTLNGSEEKLNDSIATEKDRTNTSAGIQRHLELARIARGDVDADDSTRVDVGGCRMLDVADGGRASTTRGNECRHCGFVFKHAAMFDIHMGFHKFDDPWRCNRCGQRCADRVDFNRHIATAPHPGQV